MSTELSLEDVRVHLGGKEILCGVSIDIQPGEFLTLLGPSGSGKTTTLNVIAGLVENTGGSVRPIAIQATSWTPNAKPSKAGTTKTATRPPRSRAVAITCATT